MKNDNDFLKNIAVDQTVINRTNRLLKLLEKRNKYIKDYKDTFLEHLKNEYNDLHTHFPNVEIIPEARIKSQKSYSDKANKILNTDSKKDIYDIFGNRYIIVSVNGSKSEEDVVPVLYQIRDYLAYSYSDKKVIPERIKDYVAHPKHLIYQSLHITRLHGVDEKNSFQSETQLRSYFMHFNAHEGKASHANLYKKRIPGVTEIPDSLEYVFDKDGFCIEVKDKTPEKAFEDFFGVPYDPKVFSASQK